MFRERIDSKIFVCVRKRPRRRTSIGTHLRVFSLAKLYYTRRVLLVAEVYYTYTCRYTYVVLIWKVALHIMCTEWSFRGVQNIRIAHIPVIE